MVHGLWARRTGRLAMLCTVVAVLTVTLIGSFTVVGIAQAVSVPRGTIAAPTAMMADDGTSATREAILARRATDIANAPPARVITQSTPKSLPTPTPQVGVLDIQVSPYSSHEAIIANQWHGIVGGQFTVVYAGRLTQPVDQGFVATSTGIVGHSDFMLQQYPTPTRSGSVKIVSANGTQLTLISDMGAQYTFDVATHAFVPNPTTMATPVSKISTVTPSASP